MATIDKTGTGATKGVMPYKGKDKNYVIQQTLDLTGVIPVVNDVYQLLAIPANTLVTGVHIKWLTAAVATSGTIDVGDGAGTASWDGAVDTKTTAGTFTHSTVGTDAYAVAASQGKFYASADSIDVLIKAAHADTTAGPKFTIFATCIDFN